MEIIKTNSEFNGDYLNERTTLKRNTIIRDALIRNVMVNDNGNNQLSNDNDQWEVSNHNGKLIVPSEQFKDYCKKVYYSHSPKEGISIIRLRDELDMRPIRGSHGKPYYIWSCDWLRFSKLFRNKYGAEAPVYGGEVQMAKLLSRKINELLPMPYNSPILIYIHKEQPLFVKVLNENELSDCMERSEEDIIKEVSLRID